jgi:hypothetical protein
MEEVSTDKRVKEPETINPKWSADGGLYISQEAADEIWMITKRKDLSDEEKGRLSGDIIRPFLEKALLPPFYPAI